MRLAAGLLAVALVAGCGSTTTRNPQPDLPAEGSAGAPGGGSSGGATSGEQCEPPAPAIVRLAFSEALAGIEALLGEDAATGIATELDLPRVADAFPPLASAREGVVIQGATLRASDEMAQRAGKYVRENFASVTGCQPEYECLHGFLGPFAERAYRRPLEPQELAALEQVVSRAQELEAPAQQAAEYAVYAVFSAPQFLYRTQLGDRAPEQGTETRLTGYELASSLSFFLTGGPPDDVLLELAASGGLSTPEELETQAARLLELPVTRKHLQHALSTHFRFDRVMLTVLDPAVYPEYGHSLAASMRYELEGLLEDTLWTEPLSALLTNRSARIDAGLAALYGVDLPADSPRDEFGFAKVLLPESRAGLLTRAGTQVMTSRPDGPSVVSRGLYINDLRCFTAPPFPNLPEEELQPLPDGSEREKAEARMQTEPCKGCHVEIDPFGLALDELDALGRYRTHDDEGRAIDATVALPASAGGQTVRGALELSLALADDSFSTCLSQRLLQYALVLPGPSDEATCEARRLAQQRKSPQDSSLASIVAQIVSSEAFALRKP